MKTVVPVGKVFAKSLKAVEARNYAIGVAATG